MKYEKQLNKLLPHIPIDNTKGVFIAGGALTSIFTNSEINDVDMYFKDKETAETVLEDLVDCGYFIKFVSNKAITLVNGDKTKVQIIYYKYFNSVQDIFDDFDFSVNMVAFDGDSREIVTSGNFLTSLACRTIEFNPKTPYPIISAYRTKKYQEKGYTLETKSFVKLGLAISKLNITTWEELEDQIGGIYGDLNLKDFKDDEGKIKEFNFDDITENIDSLIEVKNDLDFDITKEKLKEVTGFTIDSCKLPCNNDTINFSIPF